MQNKVSIIGVDARDKALKGANYIADAVKQTLGPFGLNALIEKGNRITNDGVTVSRELCGTIKDEFERRGATVFHEISSKTNDQVGDATTTSEILGQAIIKEAIRYLPNNNTFASKKTPEEVLRMIETSKQNVIKLLENKIEKIKDKQSLINSAKVSVAHEDLAEMIGSTQWDLGPEGYIIAEETNDIESSIESVKGIRFDNGFSNSLLINNQEKQAMEVENCVVILTNYTLTSLTPLKEVIQSLVSSGKTHIAIIARAFSSECIQLMAANRASNVYFYPINAPYTAQKDIMGDLSAITGSVYYDTESSTLEEMQLSDVGFAKKIIARNSDCIVVGGDHEYVIKSIEERINLIETKLQGIVSDFEKKLLETRISQLKNGFAILKVGAKTESERKYKKDKADDAVNAVRLALKGGTIKGAGLAFKEISEELEEGNILKKPLLSINEQIMALAPKEFIVEEWVRDPFLVLKCALENACSGAGTFATINTIIANQNKKESKCESSENE